MRALLALFVLLLAAPAWSGEGGDGNALLAEDRFAEAARAFAAAGDTSPAHAAALIRLGRFEAARVLTGDDPLHAADAFALAGEIGRARQLLVAGLADRPDDVTLLRRLGELESAARRPRQALAPLSRAAELAPADPAVRLAEIRALSAAGLPVRAAQAAEQARQAGVLVDEALLLAELAARQSYGDHRGTIAAAEPHGALVAASAAVARLLAKSLDAIGAHARAADHREAATTMEAAVAMAATAPVPLGELARGRFETLAEAERWAEAAVAALEWARLRPDDGQAAAALLRPEIGERLGWPLAFRHLATLVQRDPDDPGRHVLAMDLHAEPPGSEVLVLAHAHALDRLIEPDDPLAAHSRERRDQALERLMPLGRIVDLDLKAGRIVLTGAAGRAEAEVDPATGRLRRFTQGPRWIEADWRDDGLRLAQLVESSGARLRLDWQGDRLVGLAAVGRAAFRAEIGADGRLARMNAADPEQAARDYNAALALIASWPRSDVAGARWLWLD